jgi:signal peptidase I
MKIFLIGRRPKVTLIRITALIVVCVVTFRYLLLPIRIVGISMLPTYHNGQFNFINRLAYIWHEPARGDIVSVNLAEPDGLTPPDMMLMKRIIGLPGETVAFRDGHAVINNRLLDEPYVKRPCDWTHDPVTCGPDEYYVVGDNRSMPFQLHEKGRAKRARIIGTLLL